MKERKRKAATWWEAHREQMMTAGCVLLSTASIALVGYGIWNALSARSNPLESAIEKLPERLPQTTNLELSVQTPLEEVSKRSYTAPKNPYAVPMHRRKLHLGQHHSLKKAEQAMAMGISLPPNETLVDSHIRCANR